MRKSQWLITILLVIGFYIVQHRSVSSVALPTTATTTGSSVQIPVVMKKPTGPAEFWVLSQTADQQYFVSIFVNERVVHRFSANRMTGTDATGKNYTSIGQIKLDGQLYQVTAIHINASGTAGWISFHSVSPQAPSNQSAG